MSRGKSSHQFGKGYGQISPSEARVRPDRRISYESAPHAEGGYEGTVVCERCHAIWNRKHWHLDEKEYQQLRDDQEVGKVVCPGCEKVERQEYDGHVVLQSPLIPANLEAITGLIYNTEAHIREHNPIARIASLKVEGDTIEVLTISPFLAERIGKELRKAYDGQLEIKHPHRQPFIQVMWFREDAGHQVAQEK